MGVQISSIIPSKEIDFDWSSLCKLRRGYRILKGKPITIIEAMEVSKNTKKNRLNELSAKFEIYKKLLNSNNILVLFPKTKIETEELTILKNHCDRIFLNEDVNRLPEILRGV